MFDDWFWILMGSVGAFVFVPHAIWTLVAATAHECWERRYDGETLRRLHNATTERIQHIEETLGHPIDEVISAARHEESRGGHHAVVELFRSWKKRVRHESNGERGEVHHAV
jgi:hypothetical protein